MDGDTAELETPDTAAPDEAPPADELPETSVEQAAPETEAPETPETEAAPVSPLAGKPAEEIEKIPEVEALLRDRLAREAESVRRKAEATERERFDAQADEAWAQQARQVTVENVTRERTFVANVVNDALDNGKELKDVMPAIEQSIARLGNAAAVALVRDLEPLSSAWLQENFPEAKVSPEAIRAMAAYRNRGIAPGMIAVAMANAADAGYERGIADGRKAVVAETASKAKAAQGTQALKDAAAANGQRPGATTLGGGAVAQGWLTSAELESMPMAQWNFLKQERREELLAHADEMDRAKVRRG